VCIWCFFLLGTWELDSCDHYELSLYAKSYVLSCMEKNNSIWVWIDMRA